MACVRAKSADELRRGWAEKKMRGWRKMPAQTEATRRIMPPCAIIAVPVMRFSWRGWRGGCDASPMRPRRGSSSPRSESFMRRASGMPVAEAIVEDSRGNSCCGELEKSKIVQRVES